MLSRSLIALWALLFLFIASAHAQFGSFFEQMFGGGHPGGQQEAASDSAWYQQQWKEANCPRYLCPGTLACVDVPHHCPCPHPSVEDKVELGEGSAICVSKGGFKPGEAARKIELARKGLI